MASHVVSSFLLRVLALKTTFWMAWIFQQPIGGFYFTVSGANTRIKKEDTTWKAMKSWAAWARKCYNFLCTINFEVTWPFWKMWIYICQFSALLATTALLAILFSYNNSLSFFYWHRYFMVSYGLSLGARMRQKKNVYFPLKEDYNGP